MEPVLSIRDLQTHFFTDVGVARAVDGVSFDLHPGRTLALVGESGCGKSMTALSILRLVPEPPGRIVGGEILFEGRDLARAPRRAMREIRGNHISMIFQEPMTALNPVFRIGRQLGAVLKLHRGLSDEDARREAVELLARVGIPAPDKRVDEYPHQLSGGMRQRVMIAMALSCGPRVLIADEPTTALDVTIQAQIMELLKELQEEEGMALLLITHDLGIVAETADDVAIMYAGKIAEQASARELFARPLHPYTVCLFESLPGMHRPGERLRAIEGTVPPPTQFPPACRFHPRCPFAFGRCGEEEPPLAEHAPGHRAACWLHHRDVMEARGEPVGLPRKPEARTVR